MPRILGLQETGSKAGQFAPGRLFICLRRRPTLAGTGALLFNSGQYNRSVLISAIRVARARSRLWGQPRDPADSHANLAVCIAQPRHAHQCPLLPAHLRITGSQILAGPAVTVTSRLALTVRHQLVALAVTVYLPGVGQT